MRRFIVHPQFFANKSAVINDIAVIKLAQPLTFSNNVQPICLSKNFLESEGKFAYVAGWGLSTMTGKSEKMLHEGYTELVKSQKCKLLWHDNNAIRPDQHLCAEGIRDTNTYYGDSGGPIFVKQPHTKRWTEFGITSFGPDPYSQQVPGIYTRVSKYCDWISQVTHHSVQCIP